MDKSNSATEYMFLSICCVLSATNRSTLAGPGRLCRYDCLCQRLSIRIPPLNEHFSPKGVEGLKGGIVERMALQEGEGNV